jgi:SAM-dependent methyltransferase
MGTLIRHLRRILGLYRRSKALAFLVEHTTEARRLRREPQRVADEAHLSGAWTFDNPVEREWQRHALEVVAQKVGANTWGDSLEIGCSEGVFTTELAQRCASVTACDISPVALARAAARCGTHANVRVGPLDVASADIAGQYDLVFVMDVLWFVAARGRKARIAPKLARALRHGGFLVFSDSRMPKWVRHPFWGLFFPTGADEWADLLERTAGLTLVYKESYPPAGHSIPGYWDKVFALFRKEPAIEG